MSEEVIALMCKNCGVADFPHKEEDTTQHACAVKSSGDELNSEDIDLINSMLCMDCTEFIPDITIL
jgi:hypothetical protein